MKLFLLKSNKFFIFLMFLAFTCGLSAVARAEAGETLDDLHSGLSQGPLRHAGFDDFKDGIVLKAGEVQVTEKNLDDLVGPEKDAIRDQLRKNLLFVLDQHLMRLLLKDEADRAGIPETLPEEEAIGMLFERHVDSVTVEDSELKEAYEAAGDILGGASFEQVEETLRAYLLKEKQDLAVIAFLRSLGSDMEITLDRSWTEKQAEAALDNPVDRARASGIPTLVEFGAAGCKPCDMMQPILEKLKNKYEGRLNVVFVHVGEEQILGARYGITSIPVQAFFDASGREVNRHVGFFPEEEVEKVLASIGVES